MDILTMKARGFIGLKDTMDVEEIFIDITDLYGLIGIGGPTGMGKTTVLELLQPYPMLISRDGKLTDHVYLRDAVKENTFLHKGDHFRTKVTLDAETGRSEGYVYVNQAENSLTVKISEFKDFMVRTFGSEQLFSNSVFFAQDSEGPTSLKPAALRKVFIEFIGERLRILAEYSETSKTASNILIAKIGSADDQIRRATETLDEHSDAATTLARAQNELRSSTSDMKAVETHIDLDQAAVAALKVDLMNQANSQEIILGMKEDVLDIESEIKTITGDKTADMADVMLDITEKTGQINEAEVSLMGKAEIEGAADREKELSGQLEDLQRDKADVEKRLSVSRETLGEKEKADYDAGIVHNDALNVNRKDWQEIKDLHGETQSDIDRTSRSLADIANDPALQELSRILQGYKESAADLERRGEVVYVGEDNHYFECNSEDCPFVEKALKAEKEIPTIEAQIATATANNEESTKVQQKYLERVHITRDRITERLKACETLGRERVEAHATAQAERRDEIERLRVNGATYQARSDAVGVRITTFQDNIEKAQSLSARLPEIQVAESRLADLKAAREALNSTMKYTTAGYDSRIDAKNKKIGEIQKELDALKEKIDPEIDATISDLSDKIRHERMSLEGCRVKIKETEADIVRLEENVKTADKAAAEIKQLTDRRRFLSGHQTGHSYLQHKCGPKGIQALEIDAVAPSVKNNANTLLFNAYGPGAMVDWDTLDENGKEILEPMAINKDGKRVALSNRSGGQKQWARRAISCAMAMLANEKAGFGYETSFFDEKDDGLDEESAIQFTQMFSAFLDLGKFKKGIFISHKQACMALANHSILLGKGGVQ